MEKSILEEEKSQLSHHTSESVDSQADVQEPNQVLETNTDSPEVQSSSPNMALPHGSEKKALTSLQDSEQANRQKKNGVLTSSQLSEELARQISLKKKQIRQERESDQMYFTEVVLKDIQKYHQECKEKELNRFKSSQLYRELLGQQKLTEACSRNVDERESDMLQALKEKEKYEKEEKILQEKKKQMQLKYRNELIQQIKEQQLLNQSDDVMNNAERSINHRELSQLTNDPIKYQKVQQMLQIYAPQSSISSASNQSPVKRGRRLKGLKGL